MTDRRVVVTGTGIVSALGTGYRDTSAALKSGTCGIGPIRRFESDRLMVKIAGEASGFEPEDHFGKSELSMLDRVSQMALVAAAEAFAASDPAVIGGVVRAEVLEFRLSLLGDIDPGHPITDLRS